MSASAKDATPVLRKQPHRSELWNMGPALILALVFLAGWTVLHFWSEPKRDALTDNLGPPAQHRQLR